MRGVVITAAPELRFSRKENAPPSENEAALRKVIQDLQDTSRRTRKNLEAQIAHLQEELVKSRTPPLLYNAQS